jgi:hypothetical protein
MAGSRDGPGGTSGPGDGDFVVHAVGVRVGSGGVSSWPVVARIWRTVDVERTVAELGLEAAPLANDELLGAQGVLVRPPEGPPVAILEPSTEGRLAATLARLGEGDGGSYVAAREGLDAVRASGVPLGPEAIGPFGRSALLRPGPVVPGPGTMPFTILVESPAATIDG